MRILIAFTALILLGAGCAKTSEFQGPDDYVPPTSPPPTSTNSPIN